MPIALALAFALVASAGSAEPARVTSAYTRIDLDRCKIVDEGPQSAEWQCAGHAGIALFVQNGDDRYDVDAGMPDEDALWADAFDYPGDTVEWRLIGGKPFAIIYRLLPAITDVVGDSFLVVETVGRNGKPGCRVAKFPGSLANHNQRARDAADALLSSPAVCLKPE